MIRVYGNNDKNFSTNGDAVLVPVKAKVIHKQNSDYYIDITCKSEFYAYLTQGNIIVAPTPQGDQAFRIDSTLERKGDRVTLRAYHVFYDARNYVISDSYAVDMTCRDALRHLNGATDTPSPFTMDSDVQGVYSLRCVRKSLYEAIQDVIGRWGGNLIVDNWRVTVKDSIGKDNGITIRYAKNLIELTAKYDFSGVCTKLLPVGKDGLLLPELYVTSQTQYDIPYTRVLSIAQNLVQEDYPSKEAYQAALVEDLRRQAQETVNKSCMPVVTYTLKGRPELVSDIGDIIQVVDERIGVNITTQVIGYEYDVITGKYDSLTFGNFGQSLSGLMATVNSSANAVVNNSIGEFKAEFDGDYSRIWQLLQGSYCIYRGYDILICDRVPLNSAKHILKFSNTGISLSTTGVNGDFVEVYNISNQTLSAKTIRLNGTDLKATINNLTKEINLLKAKHKEVTKSQWDALPNTKLTDNVVYFITDKNYIILNGIHYGEGGGGGGSTVTITPTLATGTKIADFEIDGEAGALYAPNEEPTHQYSNTLKTVGSWFNGEPVYEFSYIGSGDPLPTSITLITDLQMPTGKTVADVIFISADMMYKDSTSDNYWYQMTFYGTSSSYMTYSLIANNVDAYGQTYRIRLAVTKPSSKSLRKLVATVRFAFL